MTDEPDSGSGPDAGREPGSRPGAPPRLAAIAVVVVVALVAGIILLVGHRGNAQGQSGASAVTTSTDPGAFVLPRLGASGVVRLADYRGRPVVVNFFASWCTACRGEAPGFLRVDDELHGAVAFLGVNSLESGDGLAFAHELGYTRWPLASDVGGQQDSGLHDALGGQGMPITAFYDRDGRRLLVSPGAMSEDALRGNIHDLFGLTIAGSR